MARARVSGRARAAAISSRVLRHGRSAGTTSRLSTFTERLIGVRSRCTSKVSGCIAGLITSEAMVPISRV